MLWLLPNLLDEESDPHLLLPPLVAQVVPTLDGIIAESEKGARRYLKAFRSDFRLVPIHLLNEHTPSKDLEELLKPLKQQTWGLISDAGLPCMADPGSSLVLRAHGQNIAVQAISGPSSITLALLLSGLPAQAFTFHGYFPRESQEFLSKLRSLPLNFTHLFIETPYRTQKVFEFLLQNVPATTQLSIASDLTLPTQQVLTYPVSQWKKKEARFDKKRAVFLLYTQ